MTRSLYTKFLLGYLVFGLLGFIFIATMSSEITYQYLLEEKSDSLYDEANLLASTYSDIYQGKNISLSTAASLRRLSQPPISAPPSMVLIPPWRETARI